MQKNASYPPQEQKEEIPSLLPLEVFCQHQMEYCTSARIYSQEHMHKHIEALKIEVAPYSGLITISDHLLLHSNEEDGTGGKKDKDEENNRDPNK